MIDIVELKDMIKTNTLTIDLLVFICKDKDTYIANQYINEICNQNGYIQDPIISLSEINTKSANALVEDYSTDLHILRTDTFDEDYDYGMLENVAVICEKVDKKLQSKLDQYCVEVPKLLEWQIKAHCLNIIPNIDRGQLDWLYIATNGNTYRLDNELDKISLFEINNFNNLLIELKNDDNTDLFALSTFSFVDAVIKQDYNLVAEALNHKKCWDSDPMFIMTLLLNKYKQIALVHGNPKSTPESIGLTPKQFNAIKYYYNGFNLDKVRDKIEFLSGINLRINLGEFDCGTRENFLDYLICNVM